MYILTRLDSEHTGDTYQLPLIRCLRFDVWHVHTTYMDTVLLYDIYTFRYTECSQWTTILFTRWEVQSIP